MSVAAPRPILFLLTLVLLAMQSRVYAQNSHTPNIILIIADDLGYHDLSSYGNANIHTPNIDALGTGGVRFSHAYVTSPICSPSRMAIMTGRYQNRMGGEFMPYDKMDPAFMKAIRRYYLPFSKKPPSLATVQPSLLLNRKKHKTSLSPSEITLGELLKRKGYTTAMVGKWNLGDEAGNYPSDRGYDYSYYFTGALTRYVDDPVDTSMYINQHCPWSFSDLPAWTKRYGSSLIREGNNVVSDTGYLTFSFAEKAISFIEKNKEHPFFLTLSFNAPHDPFQVPKANFDRIANETDTLKRVYYGMIEAMDDAIGNVTEKLRSLQLEENTVIIFISDNGGATYTHATDNIPFKGGKGTHFEGGLVVPFFIKYPGLLPGNNVYDKTVSSLDVFATVAAIASVALPTDRVYDGVNLLPFLANNEGTPHDMLYWRSGYSKAIQKDEWKLYINNMNHSTYLYNLNNDRIEQHDLSREQPAKVKELKAALEQWEKTQTIPPKWPSMADLLIDVDGNIYYFPS